jgi:hypothetical protein
MNSQSRCHNKTKGSKDCYQNSKWNTILKSLCLTLFILFSVLLTYSQTITRAEIDLRDSQSCYVFPVKAHGVLVQSEIIPRSGKKETVILDYFDVNLIKQKTDSFEILKCSDYYDSFQNEALNYILLWDKDNKFSLFTADFTSYKSTVFNGEMPSQIVVYQFAVLGKYLYIRCSINKQNTLLQINMETKKQTKLPLRIEDIRRNDLYSRDLQVLNDELLVFIQADINNNTSDLYMFKYSSEGKLLKTINLSKNIDEKIFEVKTTVIDNRILLSGTYAKTNSDYVQGVFFAELKDDQVVNPKFYNFLHLKNYGKFLTEKEQAAIERKSKKLADKDAELFINTYAIVHAVQKISEGYLLACDYYIPDPSSLNFISYTHASVLKLDQKGDLMWDESIKINMLGSGFSRPPLVAVDENSFGCINMSFARGKNIMSKTLDKNGKVLKEKVLDFKSLSSADTKTKGLSTKVDPWYDGYYIASGLQKVTSKSTKGKKDIYFIMKLSAEN